MSTRPLPQVGYVCFIDEAGDDGLRTIRTIDGTGATEWFVMSGVVIRQSRELELEQWLTNVRNEIHQPQLKTIHYRKLLDWKKDLVAKRISELPIRIFVLLSNKKNMRGYRNQKAEIAQSQAWFYNWCLRLLLERVTDWCGRRSTSERSEAHGTRIVISKRAGVRHSQTVAYFHKLRNQSVTNTLHVSTGTLNWHCYHDDLLTTVEPSSAPGLQVADVVASAFYEAFENSNGNIGRPSLTATSLLMRRVAKGRNGMYFNYGLKFMPDHWRKVLTSDQLQIVTKLNEVRVLHQQIS